MRTISWEWSVKQNIERKKIKQTSKYLIIILASSIHYDRLYNSTVVLKVKLRK